MHLTASDFNSRVLESSDEWLVAFIAPWCGHCKKLHPEWEDAAKQLAGEYKLGMVDATVESALAQQYNVQVRPSRDFDRVLVCYDRRDGGIVDATAV